LSTSPSLKTFNNNNNTSKDLSTTTDLITSQIMMRIYENLNNTAKKEGLLLGEENKFLNNKQQPLNNNLLPLNDERKNEKSKLNENQRSNQDEDDDLNNNKKAKRSKLSYSTENLLNENQAIRKTDDSASILSSNIEINLTDDKDGKITEKDNKKEESHQDEQEIIASEEVATKDLSINENKDEIIQNDRISNVSSTSDDDIEEKEKEVKNCSLGINETEKAEKNIEHHKNQDQDSLTTIKEKSEKNVDIVEENLVVDEKKKQSEAASE
jgi:hypothetical protein